MASWVPTTAKAYAKEAHNEIKANIDKTHAAVEKRYANFNYDSKRPTADWLSRDMKAFLPAIEDLSNKPEGVMSAIDLLIYLGEKSYTKMEIWENVPGSKGFGAERF